MSKSKGGNVTDINEGRTDAAPAGETAAPAVGPNFTLTYRRNHPGNRCSYGVDGNPGIMVVDRGLFAGTVPTTGQNDLGGMPAVIVLDAELVPVKLDNKTSKAEAAAAKAQERADKAAARAAAAALKIKERADKAAAALAAAQAKVAAAQGKVETPAS